MSPRQHAKPHSPFRALVRVLTATALAIAALPLAAGPANAVVSTTADTTWMTNGKVNSVVRIGNTIYLGGVFTQLKSKPSGGSTLAVKNLAAIDASTGQPVTGWTPETAVPNRSGEVYVVAAAPDGSRVYAGGDFTTVDGKTAKRIVALNPTTGAVIESFDARAAWKVREILALGDRVYFGGDFDSVNGETRVRLAAVELDGDLLPWAPEVLGPDTAWNGRVTGLALSSNGSMVYVVGDFRTLAGCSRRSIGAVDATTGACVTTFNNNNAAKVENNVMYGGQHLFDVVSTPSVVIAAMGGQSNYVGYYHPTTGSRTGRTSFDGDPQVLALVGCTPSAPQSCDPTDDLYVGGHFDYVYTSSTYSRDRLTMLHLSVGSSVSATVDAWNATTNSYYGVWGMDVSQDGSQLAIGGEFTWVSGSGHHYFAVFSSPDGQAPSTPTGLNSTAFSSQVTLGWSPSTDNRGVTGYEIRRNGTTIGSTDGATSFVDTGVTAGASYGYQVRARDAAGNWSGWSATHNVTVPVGGAVFADDFESGDLSGWTGSTARIGVEAGVGRSGSFGARAAATGKVANAYRSIPDQASLTYDLWFKPVSASGKFGFARLATSSNQAIITFFVTDQGKLGLRNNATGTSDKTSPVVVGFGAWHHFEADVNTTTGALEVRLDGVVVSQLSTTQDFGGRTTGRVILGEVAGGRTYDVVFDDVAVT